MKSVNLSSESLSGGRSRRGLGCDTHTSRVKLRRVYTAGLTGGVWRVCEGNSPPIGWTALSCFLCCLGSLKPSSGDEEVERMYGRGQGEQAESRKNFGKTSRLGPTVQKVKGL